ncbi:hypothetical protein B6N60_02370 [Richelia sinica FACHB-800]|uniref:Uncharacterized protein n=1 Tax=Richelia sinica FACHB-800 TaxID=1357546 RepID=A0A975T7V3_9NOST|nr:hypothetical protein B6N60_02370 [Richelia sinica FACHB-800]
MSKCELKNTFTGQLPTDRQIKSKKSRDFVDDGLQF